MSLFGSLFTGVSALTAQAQSMGMISNNIANVNTIGYKRSEASFSSLVTSETRGSRYTPGSVLANREQKIDQQGAIQQTNSTTDIAVSGNGFYVVQRDPNGIQEPLYTRAGSFSEDAQGFLRNTAGFYLMGWRLDINGDPPAGQADLSSLSPVDVAFLGGLTRATTEGEIALNLDASEPRTAFPVGPTVAADFSRGLRVFDSLGTQQDIEFRFTHHESPTQNVETNFGAPGLELDDLLTGIADVEATETIDFTTGGQTFTFTVTPTSTVQDLIDGINGSAQIGDLVTAELTEAGEIKITDHVLANTITVANGTTVVGGTGAGSALGFVTTAAPAAPNILPAGLASLQNTPNPFGWWQLELVNSSTGAILESGSINFDSGGSLNATPDAEGQIKITLENINWGNGSEDQDIEIEIDSLTQFAGEYNVIFSQQNGAELGLRTGVEIDNDGIVTARFSNGQTAALFKLPIATFSNVNGLTEVTGNAFVESTDSGSFNLREAGEGGAGSVESSSLEASNVDLADEFSRMIIVQRAYSAGTKVISTADEMTEELLRLR